MKEKIYKPKEFANLIGVSVKTLQRWDNENKLKAYRNPANRRYYTHSQYLKYMGFNNRKTIIYVRVSSLKKHEYLKKQLQYIEKYVSENNITVSEIIKDYDNGFNCNRKNWNNLINDCIENKIETIIIANKNIFTEFEFSWFEHLLEKFNVEIINLNIKNIYPKSEIINDLNDILKPMGYNITKEGSPTNE